MSRYDGPVVVLQADGEEAGAHAWLWSHVERFQVGDEVLQGLQEWGGELQGPVDWWPLTGQVAAFRTPDERRGEFIIIWVDIAHRDQPVEIKGSGPAPFG